jgi:Mn-dependent DtxR family transcriptional regulator
MIKLKAIRTKDKNKKLKVKGPNQKNYLYRLKKQGVKF